MKITLNCGDYKPTIDNVMGAELEGVYNGVGIQTDQGYFGICQRDAGLEIFLDGKLILATYDPEMLAALTEITERRVEARKVQPTSGSTTPERNSNGPG